MLKSLAVLGSLALILGGSAPLAAQARSVVSSAELETAVVSAPAGNQASVQHFLQNPRVAKVASGMGIRIADLAADVSALDEATLSQVAVRIHAADLDLAGGSNTVVISTTAIIIALLIVIILIVA